MNRGYFYDRVKKSVFGGRLSATQKAGMDRIFDVQEKYYPTIPLEWLAYALATTVHETNFTMQPIKEIGGKAYFTRMYDINGERPAKARELGNIHPGDGAKFCGMGFVQNTGRANAIKARKIIQRVLGIDVDFEADPSKLMVPLYSAVLMFEGMTTGSFTGKRLSQYFGNGHEDPVGARRIINGTDRANLIAGYYRSIIDALRRANAPAPVALLNPAPVDPLPMGDDAPHIEPEAKVETPILDDADPTTGRPMIKSTTVGAASIAGVAGAITPIVEVAKQVQDAASTGKGLLETFVSAGPWVALILVVVGFAGYIIWERHRKAKEEGI